MTDVLRDAKTQPPSPRLNPFAFPSDTDFRFVLLIATVVGISIFYFFLLQSNLPIFAQRSTLKAEACTQALFGKSLTDIDLTTLDRSLAQAYIQCTAPMQLERALWIMAGVIALLGVAFILYWAYPFLIIRRGKLVPLTTDDAPEIVAYLGNLCREVGLSQPPSFVWNPLNPVMSGLAFGRRGRYYVALSGGLVSRFYTDSLSFRAILLHELAHLINADVDKSYFAVAIWPAFLFFVVLPYLIIMTSRGSYDILPSILWYVVTLAALIYLMRAAVLRSRELFADVRASTWDEANSALGQALASLPQKGSRWLAALHVHPKPADRLRILADTGNLFQLNFWIAVGMGLSLSISMPLISQWLEMLADAGWVSREGTSFIIAIFFAALAMGVIGVGLWRATFAAQMTGKALIGVKRSALGLAVGFVIGESVYYGQIIPTMDALGRPIPLAGIVFNITFELLWAVSLAAYLFLVFRWISSSAQIWLAEAIWMRSPRLVYVLGLVFAGGILAWGVGLLLLLRRIYVSMVITTVAELVALVIGLISSVIGYIQHPVTFILSIALWAFPIMACFWRRRSAQISSAGWAFLGPTSGVLPRQELRPGLAVGIGLSAGLLYLALQIILRLFVRATGLSNTINNDLTLLLWFFIAHVALAVLVQMVAAAVTAILAKQMGWAHGLLAAFVGGCVMTVEFLAVSLLSSAVMDLSYVWLSLRYFVNFGAVASIPVVLGFSTILNWVSRNRSKTPQAPVQVIAN